VSTTTNNTMAETGALTMTENALPSPTSGQALAVKSITKKMKGRDRGRTTTEQSNKPKLTKLERRAKYTAIARDRRQDKRFVNTTCFHCRKKGHTIQNCPQKKQEDEDERGSASTPCAPAPIGTTRRICFRCGARDHSLADCPVAEEEGSLLPFATCFVCQAKGHLASTCPANDHGIFVNGGACRICQSTQHRAKTCPQRRKGDDDGKTTSKKKKKMEKKEKEGIVNDEDFSDLLLARDEATPSNEDKVSKPSVIEEKQKSRLVKF
jgi:zinc finger CCHC domain-containing protein 9